jgi:hypothetical protein
MFGDQTVRYERVNSAITFPTAEPAFVVNVGDPNNSSFYYLLRERDGKAEATYLGDSHGGVSADWLDAPAGAPYRNLTLHRGRLEGGRLLLLGEYCVLDTETLESYRFEQHRGASLSQFKLPLALSPDRRSFVRLAYDDENAETLVVFDFVDGRSYTLPIDRSLMRFGTPEEIDAVWLDHYFEWTSDGLATRKNVAPLPYRGRLTVDPNDGYREYRVQPVAPEMAERMVAFLRRDFGAELLPREQYQSSDTLRIGDRKVHVFSSDTHVGVFMDRGTDSTLVEEIARRFDVALRTGDYDELFLP